MNLKPDQRLPVIILAGVTTVLVLVSLVSPNFLQRLENLTFDLRVRSVPQPAPAATNLGFVYVDEACIAAVQSGSLGYKYGLYWPRQVYARMVDELRHQGAAGIAFDVIFAELRPDHAPVQMADGRLVESDDFFALHLKRADNVILAATPEVSPPDLFADAAGALGDISTHKDDDGVLRQARAFQTHRLWHPLFLQVQADPELGVDLRRAEPQPGAIVLHRTGLEPIRIPLNAKGEFALADFVGTNLPAGTPVTAKPFEDVRRWHMGVVIAAKALGIDLETAQVNLEAGEIVLGAAGPNRRVLPVDREAFFYINWRMPPNSPELTQQSALSLLEQHRDRSSGEAPENSVSWQGQYAIIGSSALGNDLTDRGATPLFSDTLLVSKHWNVANSIITDRLVKRTARWAEVLIVAGLAIAAGWVTWRLRALIAFVLVMAGVVGWIAIAFVVYWESLLWLPVVLPVLGSLTMTHLSLLTWRVVFEQTERRRVKSIFAKMVSPAIVDELLRSESLSLGGARREISVLFADIRGFTEFTEKSQEHAAELVRQRKLRGQAAEMCFDSQARETLETVNLYIGCIADIIIQNKGTLDKYIGDCVMAFWGAPVVNPNHSVDCVRAAIRAQRAIFQLNQSRIQENARREAQNTQRAASGLHQLPLLPILKLGTGINTGMATVGLMGSASEVCNYTVFGREVNLASRLEGLSGHERILISEATLQHLLRFAPELAAACIPLPPVTAKGIRQPVAVYEVPWQSDIPARETPGRVENARS